MRSKRFMTALALVTAGFIALAPGASAQEEGEHPEEAEELIHLVEEIGEMPEDEREEVIHALEEEAEENGGTHADAECVLILLEGGSVEDCRDAPNPLLPETNEIIWGSIGFVVVFGFLWKFGLPAAKRAMEDRSEKIREDIDAAERARTEAETVKNEYESSLGDAKTEAARIIEEARQAADQLKADQQARLNEELAASRAQAQSEIDTAKSQAMTELHSDVADIAIGAAEAVVGATLDRDAQTRLIEDYINRVGANGQV